MSLQSRLLLWMTVLLACLGVGAACLAYVLTKNETDTLLDTQLRQIATYAGSGAIGAGALPTQIEAEDAFFIRIVPADGRPAYANMDVVLSPSDEPGFHDRRAGTEDWRVFALRENDRTIEVAQRWSARDELAGQAAIGAAVPIALALPLAWAVIFFTILHLSRRFTAFGDALARRSVDARDPISATDVPSELASLVAAINVLIERHRAVIMQQRQFLSDAAHELRTPLAALQLQAANIARSTTILPGDERIADLRAGVGRAARVLDKLLQIARLDERQNAACANDLLLADLLTTVVADYSPVAAAKGVDLGLQIETTENALVTEGVRPLFANLVENAVRYTPRDGQVDVALTASEQKIIVTVCDSGIGIPVAALPRLFDRFFRAAPAEIEGSGLGLSIAQTIARQRGWSLNIGNRSDRSGVIAKVTLHSATDGLADHL